MNYQDEAFDFLNSINSLQFERGHKPLKRGVLTRPLHDPYSLQINVKGDLSIMDENKKPIASVNNFKWDKVATLLGKYISLLKTLDEESKEIKE